MVLKYNRKREQERAYRVYSGDYAGYVNTILQNRHGGASQAPQELGAGESIREPTKADELADYNTPQRNVLKRSSNLLSVMYSQPPRRRANQGPDVDEFLKTDIAGLNVTLEETHRRTNAVGDWFVIPYPGDDKRIHLELLEPWLCDVEMERGMVRSITITMEEGEEKDVKFVKWHWDGKWEKLDKGGETLSSGDSGLGVCPVVWFRLSPVADHDPWSVMQVKDLVDGTIDLGVLECYHKHNAYLRSFNVLGIEDPESVPEGLKAKIHIGNKNVLPFKMSANPLADPNDPFGGTVAKIEHDLAGTRGISSMMYSGNFSSSDQVDTAGEELKEHYRRSVKIFADPERQLIRVCLAMAKKHFALSCDPAGYVLIDYVEPMVNLDDRKKSLDVLEQDIKLGTDSPVEYLLRTNPDIKDRDAAWKIMDRNLEDKAELDKRSREHNIKKGVLPLGELPGPTPKENGALGGAVHGMTEEEKAAAIRERAGGNGPVAGYKPNQ